MPYFFQKQIILAVSALLLAATSGSAQVLSPVYNFNTKDAVAQTEGLLLSSNTLYGTALAPVSGGKVGGAGPSGAVFKLNTDGTGFTNLYIFGFAGNPFPLTNTDGATPGAQLALSGNGLYGITKDGGFYTEGIVFAVNTDGTDFTNLHNFPPTVKNSAGVLTNSDGAKPQTDLVLLGGTLFGTTGGGGSFGGGTVFAIHTDGTGFSNLHNFNATNDGDGEKSMILSGNTLYGTANSGGSSGEGTVFALNTDGTGFTNLHSFSTTFRGTNSYAHGGTNSDGSSPKGDLVLSGNKLYGTTPLGGTGAVGTVFALNSDGTGFANLHNFNSTGDNPYAGLVLSGNTLYGTAQSGGSLSSQKDGTVFAINTDGTGFVTLHTFTPTQPNYDLSGDYTNAGGSTPVGNLILSGSTLYGTTELGGTNGHGTVFALDLAVAPPTIQFTASPTNGVPPMSVQFNSPAVDSGGNAILAWNWNFGDGSNSIVQNPIHSYTNAATFFPTLTCINNNGDPIIGSGAAIIAAYPRSILNGGFETGTFTNWTQSGNFGSQSISTAANYRHSGTYGAQLTASGSLRNLSQTLSTTPGAFYSISFWLHNPTSHTNNEFQVSWNGTILLDMMNLPVSGWTNIQLAVTATTSTAVLQFGYRNDTAYFGLDDVNVSSTQPLGIAGISLSGTNLVLNGTGGQSGRTYLVLMGTNLTEPLNQWTPVATNVPGADANFSITATNAVNPSAPQRFYIIELQ